MLQSCSLLPCSSKSAWRAGDSSRWLPFSCQAPYQPRSRLRKGESLSTTIIIVTEPRSLHSSAEQDRSGSGAPLSPGPPGTVAVVGERGQEMEGDHEGKGKGCRKPVRGGGGRICPDSGIKKKKSLATAPASWSVCPS